MFEILVYLIEQFKMIQTYMLFYVTYHSITLNQTSSYKKFSDGYRLVDLLICNEYKSRLNIVNDKLIYNTF